MRVDKEEDERLAASLEFLVDTHGDDREVLHAMLDQILVDRLRFLGYSKTASIYEKQEKWYA